MGSHGPAHVATAEFLANLDQLTQRPPPSQLLPTIDRGPLHWMVVGASCVPPLLVALLWPLAIPLAIFFLEARVAAALTAAMVACYLLKCSWPSYGLKAGLYHHQGPRARAIVEGAAALFERAAEYRPPFYIFSGDWCTLYPFLAFPSSSPEYIRRWVRNTEDMQDLAVDLAFPPQGFDPGRPVLVVLHGLNGGSEEKYITDMVARAHERGWTVCIYIARGLMGTPLSPTAPSGFHGARTSDFHAVLQVLRQAMPTGTPLVACGYSMGGIVLSNYLARPVQVALNAAVCLSGTFDILANKQFERSLELWQPVLTFELKKSFAAQWNHLIEACTTTCMSALHECFNMLDWDTKIIAPLNGHGHVDEYYIAMSPANQLTICDRLANVRVPTLSLNAVDDPIIHVDTMEHTAKYAQHNENIFVLITQYGGHCGWPLGLAPSSNGFRFMSEAVLNFGESAIAAEAAGQATAATPPLRGTHGGLQ